MGDVQRASEKEAGGIQTHPSQQRGSGDQDEEEETETEGSEEIHAAIRQVKRTYLKTYCFQN